MHLSFQFACSILIRVKCDMYMKTAPSILLYPFDMSKCEHAPFNHACVCHIQYTTLVEKKKCEVIQKKERIKIFR